MNIKNLIILIYAITGFSFNVVAAQNPSISESRVNKNVKDSITIMTMLELCNEKHRSLQDQIVKLQFPFILISAISIGRSNTGIMMRQYPQLASTMRNDKTKWGNVTIKRCYKIISTTDNIIKTFTKNFPDEKTPEWLNSEELRAIIKQN
ncbi:hypothetical protein A9Q74_13385 [Colwellia sp. 39_35_sub15_T18]|nr:hypothetical protein A9Q74_13385 [Colwellia sp. 39_35_sub15_T18]